jgi:hypothetical protein
MDLAGIIKKEADLKDLFFGEGNKKSLTWKTLFRKGDNFTFSGKYSNLLKASGLSVSEFIQAANDYSSGDILGSTYGGKLKFNPSQRKQFEAFARSDDAKELNAAISEAAGADTIRKAGAQAGSYVRLINGALGGNLGAGAQNVLQAMVIGSAGGINSSFNSLSKKDQDDLLRGLKLNNVNINGIAGGKITEKDAMRLSGQLQQTAMASEASSISQDYMKTVRDYSNLQSLKTKIEGGGDLTDSEKSIAENYFKTSDKKEINKTIDSKLDQLSKSAGVFGHAATIGALSAMSGKGTSATVSPPILNYWNNRWTL